ncbi:uncharacterized protein LOC129923777 [Biomphalaria glabrata]|uniref:Uncharacterized protein LOC129923777 n=1 Tax=Biomphalaria glabrata TaxID=6526 RepID=A0A9W2ZBY0_BIOGL|nr:uncharacterized protein LOC129923777 [Biomphalaria glabrata]
MKLFVVAVLVALASANVIRDERELCVNVLGAHLCADPQVGVGKREEQDLCATVAGVHVCIRDLENFDVNSLVNNIANVVHIIDQFVGGVTAAAKREQRELCVNVLGAHLCADPHISTGKREEQDLCATVAGVHVCVRDLENFDLAALVANIGSVVHVIDQFVGGAGKREEQDLCATVAGVHVCVRDLENLNLADIVANIGKVVHVIDQFVGGVTAAAKREQREVCVNVLGAHLCADPHISTGKREEQDLCATVAGVHVCLRDLENINLAEIVTNIGNVVHVIDQFIGGVTAAAKREQRELCVNVLGAHLCADPHISTGKREEQDLCATVAGVHVCVRDLENFDLAALVANIGNVVHVIDQFVGGAGKREEQDLCATVAGVHVCVRDLENFDVSSLVNNIANVVHIIDQFVGGVTAAAKREQRELCVNVLGAHLCADPHISTGKREEQDLCATVAGVHVCVRDLENFDVNSLVSNIANVVHIIDQFVGGTAKREEQDLCATVAGVHVCVRDLENLNLADIVANIGKVVHVIDQFVGGVTAAAKREQREVCVNVLGAHLCADPHISTGKREEQDLCATVAGVHVCLRDLENINLAEIVTNIGNVVHVIDQFIGGVTAAAKREQRELCVNVLGAHLCADPHISTGKREEQDLCATVAGVHVCVRDLENFDLAALVANIGNVVHVIDQFVGGAGKREEQDLCATVVGVHVCVRDIENFDVNSLVSNIANVVHIIDQFVGGVTAAAKREQRELCVNVLGAHLCADPHISTGKREEQDLCATVAGVHVCVRDLENFDVNSLVSNIANVVHIIDQFVGGTAKREEQDLCATVAGVHVCVRDLENFDLAALVANIGNVVHVIDQFVGGITAAAKREQRELCVNVLGAHLCADPHISTGKREEQDLCATVAGVHVCVRDLENFDITSLVNNIGSVVHIIDQFVSGTGKREEQDSLLCPTIMGVQICL